MKKSYCTPDMDIFMYELEDICVGASGGDWGQVDSVPEHDQGGLD